MSVHFNINRALFALSDFLESQTGSVMLLTVRPSDSKLFEKDHKDHVAYANFISGAYLIIHPVASLTYNYYLFIRNGIDKSTGSVTAISSIELGYIDSTGFVSVYKKHLLETPSRAGILDSLDYESDLDHKKAIIQFLYDVYSGYLTAINVRENN
jgi:hypothetical protein